MFLLPLRGRFSLGALFLTGLMILSVLSGNRAGAGDDWAQFLGPQRNGISQETDLIDTWPEEGLPLVWRTELGVGMSGLAIAGDRAFTMYQDDVDQFAVCLNANSGEVIWKQPVARTYRNRMGNGPRATPTAADDRVFVFSGDGVLAALEATTGKIIWSVNTVEALGGKIAEYGMASSPLLVGERVIVTVGAPGATLAAYACDDGQLAWTAGADRPGYSSPTLLEVGGRKQIVTVTGNSVLGVEPADGAVLWRFEYETDYDCNIATPIAIDQKVFVSAGENHGSAMLAVDFTAAGTNVRPIWESHGRNSVMRNEWQTSIAWDGFLFGLDNVGSAGAITHLNCVKADTGQRVWQEVRFGKSNMIAADGKLFGTTMEGEIFAVKLSPEGFHELGRMRVLEPTRQAPSLAHGFLYARDDRDVICVSVKASK